MKKLLLFVMMLFLVCGCSKNSDELVMVTEAGFAPYEYYRDGEIVGVDVDIAKEIAKELGSIGDTYVSEHFKDASVVRQKKYLAAAEDLKASKVDAIVMDELPAKQIILNNTGLVILDEEITSDSYGMIVKKGNKELLLAINKVIDRLKSEGKIDEFVLNHTEE